MKFDKVTIEPAGPLYPRCVSLTFESAAGEKLFAKDLALDEALGTIAQVFYAPGESPRYARTEKQIEDLARGGGWGRPCRLELPGEQ
jgi:hypothetical protein